MRINAYFDKEIKTFSIKYTTDNRDNNNSIIVSIIVHNDLIL